jgi:hypothetical protein
MYCWIGEGPACPTRPPHQRGTELIDELEDLELCESEVFSQANRRSAVRWYAQWQVLMTRCRSESRTAELAKGTAPAGADELDPRAGAAELSMTMLRRSITMSIRGQDSRTRTGHSLQRMMMSSTRGQVQLRTYADTRKSTRVLPAWKKKEKRKWKMEGKGENGGGGGGGGVR